MCVPLSRQVNETEAGERRGEMAKRVRTRAW